MAPTLPRRHLSTWVLALALAAVALLLAPMGAGSAPLEGSLNMEEPVLMDGTIEAGTDRGLGHLYTSNEQAKVTLDADRIKVELGKEEGTLVEGPDGSTIASYRASQSVEDYTFTDATMEASYLQDVMQTLAIEEPGETNLQAQGDGEVTALPSWDEQLTRHWFEPMETDPSPPESLEGDPPIGFWYNLEGPWVGLQGLNGATITGNFTLFVNNATIHIESDQGPWDTWTGFQTTDPQTPTGPLEGTNAKEYEVHVVTINVTHGTLTLQSPDDVDVYSPRIEARFDGQARAPQASGELIQQAHRYILSQDPLSLQGQGKLAFSTTPPGGHDQNEQKTPELDLGLKGEYTFTKTPQMQTAPLPQDHVGTLTSFIPGPVLGALSTLLGLTLIVAALTTAAPQRVHGWASQGVARWRARRYQRWLSNAKENEALHEYARATRWWGRITKHYPERRFPWLRLAIAHLEAGNAHESLEALHAAHDQLDALPVDFLEVWVAAAWSAGQEAEARGALLRLADQQPDMAKRIVENDPAYAPLREDEEIRSALKEAQGSDQAYA